MRAEGFVPLEDFWAGFFEMTARPAPPPREPAALAGYLRTVFGDLAEHAVAPLAALPFEIACTGCRNNTAGAPRPAICRTHVGVIKGVLQAMTHVPLALDYRPGDAGRCTITASLAGPLVAHARRLAHVEAAGDGTRFWVTDRNRGEAVGITAETFAVLAALDEERTPAALAAATGLGEPAVRAILDQCYALGLVSCRFAPAASDASVAT